MRLPLLPVLLACTALLPGCATVFSGSHQTVRVDSVPPGATVVILGEPTSSVILRAEHSVELAHRVLGLLGPFLPAAVREQLAGLGVGELVAQLAVGLEAARGPGLEVVAALPQAVKDELRSLLGLELVGTTPATVRLRKGREYAVIAWREGFRPKIAGISGSFNFVVLLNVLNVFLGVPIDILTGAWLSLDPGDLRLVLEARP